MAVPDFQTLMLPVLTCASHGPVRMPEIAPKIADDFSLTEDDRQQMLPSGRQLLFYNRLAWAKFHMSKAGLLDTPSTGRFELSELGSKLLATNPERVDIKLLRTFPKYAAFVAANAGLNPAQETIIDAVAPTATPEEQIDAGYTVLQSALKADLLQRVLSQTPAFFERVIIDLLVAMGYGGTHERAALRLGKSGDGGVDGVIDEDRLGLDRIYVQAKRYAAETSVSRPDVQGFAGSLVGLGATKGVFVTTSTFSSHAREYVRHLPQRVILIDGSRLAELMLEHGVGVRISRTVLVKKIDEDFFVDG